MKSRLIASLSLAAAVVVGASGCSMISTQATTFPYSPADGVTVPDSPGATLKVLNALIVATDDGTEGNFVAAIVNETDQDQLLSIEFGTEPTTISESVRVPAGASVSLGFDGAEPLPVRGLNTPPGADVPASFQSGDGNGVLTRIPVLDGSLDYLAPFVP